VAGEEKEVLGEGRRWTVDAKWGEEMPFDGMKGLGEDVKGQREVTVVAVEEEARGSTRPRPRGAAEGSRRAAEGCSPGGRDEAEEGDGQI